MIRGRTLAVALVAAGAIAVAGAGTGYAVASSSSATAVAAPGTLYGCLTPSGAVVNGTTVASGFKGCPKGDKAFTVASIAGKTGAAGKNGVNGKDDSYVVISLTGKAGPCNYGGYELNNKLTGVVEGYTCNGAPGTQGPGAILTVSAQTVIKNWPESSGWAVDAFTRNVTLTREGAVPASDCGAGATSCYLYTETLADNGGFTTVDGHLSPNAPTKAVIKGAWAGTMIGGGKLEFYASSNSPDPSLVPGTADGSAKPSSTTNWYKLFFKSSTQFGLTSGPNVPWAAYDWEYSATVTCGTNATQSEHWSDSINPGDDGQGASDGNITGSTACKAAA